MGGLGDSLQPSWEVSGIPRASLGMSWSSFWGSLGHLWHGLCHLRAILKMLKNHEFLYYFEHWARPGSDPGRLCGALWTNLTGSGGV